MARLSLKKQDNAIHQMFTVSKTDLLKMEAQEKAKKEREKFGKSE
jgi:hypothetical protein